MKQTLRRVLLIVLDSVGCGDAPDAANYGDSAANTLANIATAVGGMNLPNLGSLGLGNITTIQGVPPTSNPKGAFGRLTEVSAGKDTTTGHWEIAGIVLEKPFPVYPDGFPSDLMSEFERRIGRQTIGNFPASGTEIIKQLGQKHVETGMPIVYTSADSVFQVAAHEGIIPLEELYWICTTARELLVGEHAVGRVIARPFIGNIGEFSRTENRRDFSLKPFSETILDRIKASGKEVVGIGKIEDIYANCGITRSNHTGNNMAGVDAIINYLQDDFSGLIFANLVDFDALFGHRNNPRGYADALEAFDRRLSEIMGNMRKDDVLIITADHGNDPTTPGTDHSRERTPVLVYGSSIKPGINIGTRSTFTDIAATVGELLDIEWKVSGKSFAREIVLG